MSNRFLARVVPYALKRSSRPTKISLSRCRTFFRDIRFSSSRMREATFTICLMKSRSCLWDKLKPDCSVSYLRTLLRSLLIRRMSAPYKFSNEFVSRPGASGTILHYHSRYVKFTLKIFNKNPPWSFSPQNFLYFERVFITRDGDGAIAQRSISLHCFNQVFTPSHFCKK